MTAIKVENISKVYKLYDSPTSRLKEALHPFRKKYHQDFYALRDVSFEIEQGETLGIIGKNGSGKSTLLQIITGVVTPTSGSVTVKGKISALLELEAGFNPEFTGIENIYFHSSIMEYSKQEIDERLDNITAFADIGDFIHQPIKTYSSGMLVRLAFAVAINVAPDILIIDEALAVGDMRFQQKCYRKIWEFKQNKKSILFVTHDTGAILNFCDRALWLSDGQIVQIGNPDDVVKRYASYMTYGLVTSKQQGETTSVSRSKPIEPNYEQIEWEDVSRCTSFGEGGAEIQGVALYAKDSYKKVKVIQGGEAVIFFMKIAIKTELYTPITGILVKDEYGNPMVGINTNIYDSGLKPLHSGERILVGFDFVFPKLKNGYYSFTAAIADGTQLNHIQHHWVHDVYLFKIVNKDIRNTMGAYIILDDVQIAVNKFVKSAKTALHSQVKTKMEIARENIAEEYLKWYYNTEVWQTTTFMGIPCLKSVSDMWNYQEIIAERKPALVIEFGMHCGGSALFFSTILKMVNPKSKVLTVDINDSAISPLVKENSHIEILLCSSTNIRVSQRIQELREEYEGGVFAILDSDHTKQHVLAEMESLRTVLTTGDYLVIEDGIINHPILPGWGEGPMEALIEYFEKYPDDYVRDIQREKKFGFTFAPHGFLIWK